MMSIPGELIQSNFDRKTAKTKPNPRKTSSFLSQIFLAWYDSLAWAGFRKTLTADDLWDLNSKDACSYQLEYFESKWPLNKDDKLTSILVPIFKCHGWKYFLATIMKIGGSSLQIMQPLILTRLIAHVSTPAEETWKGFLYLTIVVSAVIGQSLLSVNSDKMVQIICMRIKAALSNAVYRKSLKISNAAKTKDFSVGTMLNLISVDVQKFMDFIYVHIAPSAPLIITACTYILYESIGSAAFVGIGVLGALMIISNVLIIWFGAKFQRQGMILRDDRIRMTSEVLGGIKVLKFYGWEIPFQKKILAVRSLELKCVWKLSWILSLAGSIYAASPIVVAMATFSCFLFLNPEDTLTPARVFVLINIMNILKGYMVILPAAFINLSQIYVSLKRLNQFFQLDELKQGETQQKPLNELTDNPFFEFPEQTLFLKNVSFSWTPTKMNTLEKISLEVKSNELVAVVGRIGAGKSTLLAGILGEVIKTKGILGIKQGSVAYVAQTPWLRNASLRDNILFGSSYDATKYETVIRACALTDDIDLLPKGDLAEIGENGCNLSGGQKQRVALARAVYKDASLYLLDDPLSAVDASVGLHIFEKVIGPNGILSGKTRLLVTHNTSILAAVDKIIVMKNGRLTETGTYAELVTKEGDFAEFLTAAEEKKGEPIAKKVEGDNNASVTQKVLPTAGKLVVEETSGQGRIKFRYYFNYFTSAGLPIILLAILFFLVSEGLGGFNYFYLSQWSTNKNLTLHNDTTSDNRHLTIFLLLGCGQGLATFIAYAALTIITVIATKTLHAKALERILRCPMSYFDSTLKGTLLSRFSRDVEVTDFPILNLMRLVSVLAVGVMVTVIMISIAIPLFLVALVPISALYILLQRFYVSTSRQLKRIESVSRSPIYSHFGETLAGLNTIRAFGTEKIFIAESERRIDSNQKCYFSFIVSTLWVSLRLELIGATIVFCTGLLVLLGRSNIDPGSAGLALTYALSITIHLNLLARLSSDLENNLVSVERLSELTETPQENDWDIPSTKPDTDWPTAGKLSFENYGTRYRPDLDLVLNTISIEIRAGEKIGVVGRTGAGKSSLTMALFRIIEPSNGTIRIDGIDLSTLGLQELRRRITIIPQEPLLFSGSLRTNLDPFDEYSDEDQWKCLELAHLKKKVESGTGGLDFKVEEDGKNFSVGERQLICLARALLRRSKILVLDEATAAIDIETDELIQGTIRREFSNSTILTIAHRLNTIMDSDRILVLSNGSVAELDTPSNLLNIPHSLFGQLARNANLFKTLD